MKLDLKWLAFGLTDEHVKGAIIVGWRGAIALLFLYVFVGWQMLGITRPARADEVDKKIETAIQPIKQEMAEQRTILNDVSRQLTDSLAESKATEIRHLVSRRCKETDPTERNRTIREIDRKQGEYKRLRGERYSVSCEEV